MITEVHIGILMGSVIGSIIGYLIGYQQGTNYDKYKNLVINK